MGYEQFRYARRVDGDTVALYNQNLLECLRYKKTAAGVTTVYGQPLTGNSLRFYSNLIDSTGYLFLTPDSYCTLGFVSGQDFRLKDGATTFLKFKRTGTDAILEASTSNDDLSLLTGGTGVVKFGTHTGTGDVVCNGNIPIKDAAGNARKLMTTA